MVYCFWNIKVSEPLIIRWNHKGNSKMKILSFFFESTMAASKIRNANHQVGLDSAERLIDKFCDGERDTQGHPVPGAQSTIVRGRMPGQA